MMGTALGNNGTPTQDCALVGEGSAIGVHQPLGLPIPVEEPPFPWMASLPVAAIIVIDPMRHVKIEANILKTLYRITPAKIEPVNAMANGIKPVKFAAQAGKSVPAVQTLHWLVFQKVGMRNQLELMHTIRDLTTVFEELSA